MKQPNIQDGLTAKPGNARFPFIKDSAHTAEMDNRTADDADDEFFIRQVFSSSPEQGCELLFRRYHRVMCSHAARYVYSKEVAEDLVSDVFCKFWKNRAYESVTSSFRYYLFRSVRNEAFSYLKAEFKQIDSLENINLAESSVGLRPDTITEYEETFNRVKELVEQLPPQCRKVFLMSRFEGKRYQEIADELGLSIKTVEVHIVKGLSLMRRGLKDYVALSMGLLLLLIKNG